MNIIEAICNSIPDELTSDKVFQILKETFMQYLEMDELDFTNPFSSISILEEAFADIDFASCGNEFRNKINFVKDTDTICSALLTGNKYMLSLSVVKIDDGYRIRFGIDTLDCVDTIHFEYNKFGLDHGFLEIRKSKKDNEYYLDYSYEMKELKNGELVSFLDEESKDADFMNRFSIPKHLVREYRTHFSKYTKEINQYKDIGMMSYFDEKALNSEDLVFQLFDNIDHFISYLKHYTMLEGRLEAYTQALNGMKSQIAGAFEISVNLLDNLQNYLLGFADNIKTRGIIISKDDDMYRMYYALFQDNQIVYAEMEEDQEQLDNVYSNGDYNMSDADQAEPELRRYLEDLGIDPDTGRLR